MRTLVQGTNDILDLLEFAQIFVWLRGMRRLWGGRLRRREERFLYSSSKQQSPPRATAVVVGFGRYL